MPSRGLPGLFAFLVLLAGFARAQTPEWIWSAGGKVAAPGETRWFKKQFRTTFEPQQAMLTATGDDEITVFINGKEVARSTHWEQPAIIDVTRTVLEGTNTIAAFARNNAAGAAAILVKLEIRSPNGFGVFIVTDGTWGCATNEQPGWQTGMPNTTPWASARSLGPLGVAPWGDALMPPQATPAESLAVLPGFKAELLRSAQRDEGSWIAMCLDGKGRLIISPEKSDVPLLRVTLTESGGFKKIERLASPLRAAMGLCWAYDSLYVNGRGPKGVGLYRLIDSNDDDQFNPGEEKLLKNFEGDNEHGYHAVAPGPDGSVYVMNGNHTRVPPGLAADSPYTNYAEDLLLPRQWDANGHAKGVLAPGGYILRTDRDGRDWRLICGGFRNTYDFDFSPQGEIFTFDSDMEWDIGAPWYRPTRILHCVSGGEYGWRSGTGKWPASYPESLPAAVDIGLSSPTATRFGTASHFPERYRRALYAADWNYGKIFAVHLEPDGASYRGSFETFISGKPLAVSGMTFGHDGAMYFIIGGWRIQSGLYRISHVDSSKAGPQPTPPHSLTGAQMLRRQLERLHGTKSPQTVAIAWPHLASEDRWIRFAARVAVEFQDVSIWRARALAETNLNASLAGLLALARCGDSNDALPLVQRLCGRLEKPLNEAQTIDALRALQLVFIRMVAPGTPKTSLLELCQAVTALYPSRLESVNRELVQILVYLESPVALTTTLALISSAPTQQEQMHYAFALRNLKQGWTAGQRQNYFAWYQKALAEYRGGASFRPFLINMRKEALANLTSAELASIAPLLEERSPEQWKPQPRDFVKEWSLAELEPGLAAASSDRSFNRARRAFVDAQCMACHSLNGEGGSIGPDLTGVSGRFGRRDLLENIVLPSRIISDRYQTYTVTLKDGDEFTGFITEETENELTLLVNPLAGTRETIAKKSIASREIAKTSAMPEGLINVLSKEEIIDIVAFLEADGKITAPVWAGK